MKFLYSVPENYNISREYPAIIALHGYGANMDAFHDLFLSTCQKEGYVLVTPQGDLPVENGFGFGWSENSEEGILHILDFIGKKMRINKKQVYIIGFSDGGRIAYQLSVNHFNKFKGIAALCAPFKPEFIPQNFVMLKDFRAYLAYGEYESVISKQAKLAADILKHSNIKVKLVEYKNIGHSLPEPRNLEIEKILEYFEE